MRVALFGGTTEGRSLARFLAEQGLEVHLFVATGYGEEMVEAMAGLTVTARRMDAAEMAARLRILRPDSVVDATHPYAAEATANIRAACRDTGIQYLRLLREVGGVGQSMADVHEVADAAGAAALLESMPGKALLTLGSKELGLFTALPDWRERFVARVLPSREVLAKCEELGFPGRNIIAMQGPFSREMNVAMLRQAGAKILVTKDSGREGGFGEKLAAAEEAGAQVIVVRRPVEQEQGYSQERLAGLLTGREGEASIPPEHTTADALPRFPLFLPLAGKPVLVVGGGAIALRRVRTLLEFGAVVTVLSPELTAELWKIHRAGGVTWVKEKYGGFTGVYALAVAATNNRQVNRRVGADARALGIPVSVCDRREECTFWFPAVVREGNLVAGITSTDGDHAAVKNLAGIIRNVMGEQK